MRITVRLFASYRELAGEEIITLELDEGRTVADVLAALRRRCPALGDQAHAPLTARNLVQVGAAHALADGDEVAVFPPVSGG